MKTNPVKVDIYNADICLYIYIWIIYGFLSYFREYQIKLPWTS